MFFYVSESFSNGDLVFIWEIFVFAYIINPVFIFLCSSSIMVEMFYIYVQHELEMVCFMFCSSCTRCCIMIILQAYQENCVFYTLSGWWWYGANLYSKHSRQNFWVLWCFLLFLLTTCFVFNMSLILTYCLAMIKCN